MATAQLDTRELIRAAFPNYAIQALRIVTKDAHTVPFDLNFAQSVVNDKVEAQWAAEGRVRVIVLKARQEGVSTYVAGRFFRRCISKKNQRILIVADNDERAETLFDIYDRFDTELPEQLRPMKRSSKRGRLLHYANPDKNQRQESPGLDSKISVRSSNDKKAGRSATIHAMHLSEMAFWDKGEETFISLMSALPDDGSECIIESTAIAAGDLFHQTWEEAVAGENGFIAIFLPWWIMPEYSRPCSEKEREVINNSLDEFETEALTDGIPWEGENYKLSFEQLKWRRETWRTKCKSDWVKFAQEYPATAEEAFVVSGAQFFEPAALKDYIKQIKEPFRGSIVEKLDPETLDLRIEVAKDISGYVRVWDAPNPGGHYVIGADTASGKLVGSTRGSFATAQSERGGRDFSCAQVLDVRKNKVVAQLHGRMAPEVFADQVALLGRYYSCMNMERNPALLAVEVNHKSGASVIDRLTQVIAYPKMYLRREFNQRFNKTSRHFGWTTTQETRPMMLDELSTDVRSGAIGIPDKDTLREMSTFIRRDDGSPAAQEGLHDDRVMALAIAKQAAKFHGCSTGVLPPLPNFSSLIGD